MSKQINIGLFGFGCVGQGLYDILQRNHYFNAKVKHIGVAQRNKPRPLPAQRFTFDPQDILADTDVNLVVELINDANEALALVKEALVKGKNVVTANKKMLAENLQELIELQANTGSSLLYEGSCCGSIPILRTLEEYFDNEPLRGVWGIFNGSSNYILSKVFNEGMSYAQALAQAQELGFAEKDPSLDVMGFDALNKLCIITAHAYGMVVPPASVLALGIQHLNDFDIRITKEKGLKVKPVAMVQALDNKELVMMVLPVWVNADDALYAVEDEYNAVVVDAVFAGLQLFKGKGAGGHPTGSAVLSDISANNYQYRYTYRKKQQNLGFTPAQDFAFQAYVRYEDDLVEKLLMPEQVVEKGAQGTQRYFIGQVSLANLLAHKETLSQVPFFLAATPNLTKRLDNEARKEWALNTL